MQHPRRRNVTTPVDYFTFAKLSPKNGEPQRSSWEGRRKEEKKTDQFQFAGAEDRVHGESLAPPLLVLDKDQAQRHMAWEQGIVYRLHNTRAYTCRYICTRTCMHIHIHACANMYTYVCNTLIEANTYVCKVEKICLKTETHHTHTHTSLSLSLSLRSRSLSLSLTHNLTQTSSRTPLSISEWRSVFPDIYP